MAPWDELQYFDLPVVTTFTTGQSNAAPVVLADPQRALLYFGSGTTGTIAVSPVPGVTVGTGFAISQSIAHLRFSARDDPTLCQAAWYANIGTGGTLFVVTVRLREWPRSNAVQRVGAPLPWERLVRPQWPGGKSDGPDRP